VNAYTLGDVARICGVSPRRLRYWERTALVNASTRAGDKTAFDFRDLVVVRSLVGLIQGGVKLRAIRTSVDAVREYLPQVDPLAALRAWGSPPRVVVRCEGVLMEPSGQLLFDFALESKAAPVAALPPAGPLSERMAAQWFERGCQLDGDRSGYGEAARAYERAIEIDPAYADAHCNLGSVRYNQNRRDEARRCFERAVELEPGHVEANLNLGALCEEDGRDERALRHYRSALEANPLVPDTHVSLALLYEKLGLPRTGLAHWKRLLQLDPAGHWADVARRRLAVRPN
jgi:tetratricopeptide (TPR) repeat protein